MINKKEMIKFIEKTDQKELDEASTTDEDHIFKLLDIVETMATIIENHLKRIEALESKIEEKIKSPKVKRKR